MRVQFLGHRAFVNEFEMDADAYFLVLQDGKAWLLNCWDGEMQSFCPCCTPRAIKATINECLRKARSDNELLQPAIWVSKVSTGQSDFKFSIGEVPFQDDEIDPGAVDWGTPEGMSPEAKAELIEKSVAISKSIRRSNRPRL